MTATPIRATKPPAILPENGEPSPTAELEIVNNNIALWREVTDEALERYFRQKYFGNESISRQEAIDRLVAIGAKRFRIEPVYATARQDTNGSVATLNELAESAAKARVATADIQILLLPNRRLSWRSMLLSILAHGLILSLLLSIQLPQHRTRMIDFDTETITYYKISESLPKVAPKQHSALPNSLSEFSPADL